jgi:hypothetical protein
MGVTPLRFRRSTLPFGTPFLVMDPGGVEPPTNGLRARCSAIEPRIRKWTREGSNLRRLTLQASALPLSYRSVDSEVGVAPTSPQVPGPGLEPGISSFKARYPADWTILDHSFRAGPIDGTDEG